MASYASTTLMYCFLAVMAVFLRVAAATAPSPMMAASTPTVTSEVMEWLKATVLPLAVFLVGSAYTGACIRVISFRRNSRGRGGDEPSNAPAQQPDLERAGDSLELQHARIDVDDDLAAATSAQVPLAEHGTPLESPNDEGKYEPTDVALKV